MIACRAHLPDQLPAPVLLCCHGLLSHKDSRKLVAVGELMSANGMAVVRFDFSGCGESPAWGGPLLKARLADLRAVVGHVLEQPWSDGSLGLFGSSMGGYLALLLASRGDYRAQALVCWSTPFDLQRVQTVVQRSEELRQRLTLGRQDAGFEGLGAPMSLVELPALEGALLIHGQRDEAVPWRDAVRIYRRLGEPRRLLLLENADHRLTDPDSRELALRASLDWLRERGLATNAVERLRFAPNE